MRYICRKDGEVTKTLVDHCDQWQVWSNDWVQENNGCGCNQQWTRLNCGTMLLDTDEFDGNLVAGVECLVQQSRKKIMGTLIPDRDMDCEKRNCERGFESLETIDNVRHEGKQSSIVEGVAGHELMLIDPMTWWDRVIETMRETAVKKTMYRYKRDLLRDESNKTVNVVLNI